MLQFIKSLALNFVKRVICFISRHQMRIDQLPLASLKVMTLRLANGNWSIRIWCLLMKQITLLTKFSASDLMNCSNQPRLPRAVWRQPAALC